MLATCKLGQLKSFGTKYTPLVLGLKGWIFDTIGLVFGSEEQVLGSEGQVQGPEGQVLGQRDKF